MSEGNFNPENPYLEREKENIGIVDEVHKAFFKEQVKARRAKKGRQEFDEDLAEMDISSIGMPEANLWIKITGVGSYADCLAVDIDFQKYRENLLAEIQKLEEDGKEAEVKKISEGKIKFANFVGRYLMGKIAKYELENLNENRLVEK